MENTIQQVDSTTLEFQQYVSSDKNILISFPLHTQFNVNDNHIEYFIFDENTQLIPSSNYITSNYSIINGDVIIHPDEDLIANYYNKGSYYIQYNFLRNLLNSSPNSTYYISEINSDRTEIRLYSNTISEEDIVNSTNSFIDYRENSQYFVDFYLNLGNNNLLIANNIKLDTNGDITSILIKLYEPLPSNFDLKQQLWIVEKISEPQTYLVNFNSQSDELIDYSYIQGPDFDIKPVISGNTLPYSNLNLMTSSNNIYNQLYNIVQDNSLNINVDYENFSNFIHFSSAEYRLKSFYNKVHLLELYNDEIDNFLVNITGSNSYTSNKNLIEDQKNNIIQNFDAYENFLYFNSGSLNSWPKQTNTIPYSLCSISSSLFQTWWNNQIELASDYDQNNKDWLYWSIPEYLRDDPKNNNYSVFLNMIGHHYDNVWIYIDTISNKFNADNRINYGISKNLVAEAIHDFGVKLYSNNFNTNDLYTSFIGVTEEGSLFPVPNITGSMPVPSGLEYIDTKISASNGIIPLDDVNKRIYKRIYHNIPYLLKTKGTPQGLRALTNIFGIPSNILSIKEYGNKTHYSASYHATIYDNLTTGSNNLPDGDTLSNLVSIQPKNDVEDLPNYLEVAFSPQDNINQDIMTTLGEFNIGEYIGDPSQLNLNDYPDLRKLRENYFIKYLSNYNLNDFIRLIKYFDNSLFKMLKDFIPAKIDSSVGIVIKPHLLERSKHNLISGSKESLLKEGELTEIHSSSGGTGGAFEFNQTQNWNKSTIFPYNLTSSNDQIVKISDNREFYNGELPNSFLYTKLNYSLNSSSLNQSDNIRTNPLLQDIDYTTNISTPVNIDLILSGSASRGTVPESNYTQKSFRTLRYDGSKISSLDINNTGSLTGSFGKKAPVESKKAYFAYVNNIVDPYPLINDKTYFKIKYLIDDQTNINNPLSDESTYYNLINTFTNIETIKSSLNVPKQETQFTQLNNIQNITRVAEIAVPILYSQTSSNGYSSTIPMSGSNQNPDDSSSPINYGEQTSEDSITSFITHDQPSYDVIVQINDNQIFYDSRASSTPAIGNLGVIDGTNLNPNYKLNWNLFVPLDTWHIGNTVIQITISMEQSSDNISWVSGLCYNSSDIMVSFYDSYSNKLSSVSLSSLGASISGGYNYISSMFDGRIFSGIPGAYVTLDIPVISNSDLTFKYTRLRLTVTNDVSSYQGMNPSTFTSPLWTLSLSDNSTPLTLPYFNSTYWKYSGSSHDILILDSIAGNFYCTNINPNARFYQTNLHYQRGINSHFPNNSEPIDIQFPEVGDYFEIQINDQIRFENNENKTYSIKGINNIIDSGSPKLKITLDRPIPSGSTDLNFFLIRRYKESADTIIIDKTFPYTNPLPSASLAPSTTGFIFPKYPIDSIATGSDKIIRDLIDKKIIE